MTKLWTPLLVAVLAVTLVGASSGTSTAAWEPTKPVEFNVAAGTGGGADLMARFIAPLFQKNNITKQPWIVTNRPGGAGAEGFLHMKSKVGDEHMVVITLSNVFTLPYSTGIPFSWRDLTPISRLALDYFVLWVPAESPYKTAKEYFDAVKKEPGKFKMGGTGTKQEDQIITVQLEQAFGVKFSYVPFKGGGEVAVKLVGKHVDSTVNNPAEAVSHWRAGTLRPLAVIDHARIPLPEWDKIPTLKEATGVDISYMMIRGILAPPKVKQEVVDGYVTLFKKVTETDDFKKYLNDFALKSAFLTGPDFVKWMEENDKLHKDLMTKGGMLKQ
jgi:tripartite-type tricarboxylate transporter receptor subunit TctC